ncbi:hypothetical protein VKT23_008469 [Stygiomarasmius scandens]|uniref:PEBP-like protein n=1 Tax=Marasmiellus scandens TaxID=2682957 RepID=A0ABR1JL68_9AGAR
MLPKPLSFAPLSSLVLSLLGLSLQSRGVPLNARHTPSDLNSNIQNVQQAFNDAKIVGSVVPSFDPTAALSPIYVDSSSLDPSSSGIQFVPGGNLTTAQTMNQPEFWLTYNDASLLNDRFVIALVDPDAPTPGDQSLAQIRHFIGGDYVISSTQPSGTARLTNLSAGLAEYVAPGPPEDSAPHRYTFLVYKQPPNFSEVAPSLVNSSTALEAIVKFNLSSFAESTGLGEPIAGTFFFEGPEGSTVSNEDCALEDVTSMPSGVAPSAVKQSFEDAGIVADVIGDFEPTSVLDVAFPGDESPVYVITGGNLTKNETSLLPSFWLTYDDPSLLNETFIITMVDPDAPTPQNRSLAEVRHLVLADVRINGSASEGTALLSNSTPALSEYLAPGPLAPSDPHRYVFLVWKQPEGFDTAAVAASFDPAVPVGFDVSEFASTYSLGSPVAGNFFFEGPTESTEADSGAANAAYGNLRRIRHTLLASLLVISVAFF